MEMKWANRKMGKRRRNKEESARSGTKVICPLFSVDITLMDLKVNHQACKKKNSKKVKFYSSRFYPTFALLLCSFFFFCMVFKGYCLSNPDVAVIKFL